MSEIPSQYLHSLEQIKQQILESRHRAAMAVNSHLIFLYWQIGRHILAQQAVEGWGTKVIQQLSQDLGQAFPEMKGFSPRNLDYMRQFAQEWPEDLLLRLLATEDIPRLLTEFTQQPVAQTEEEGETPLTQQPVAQIENEDEALTSTPHAIEFDQFESLPIGRLPWSHHTSLLDKLSNAAERWFYCVKIIENGWSRKVLLNQLERGLHTRQGALTQNFATTLPAQQSELATETFKDPYFFDFLTLGEEAKEREVEDELIRQITNFLLELGAGFAYMGKQYKLEVGGQEYFLDLLFYHTRLRCYITIELKIGEFKPEYVGKVQFYLAALDDLVKHAHDNPSIGLILVKEANRIVAEYALRDSNKPIGVAGYRIVDQLPENLRDELPSTASLQEKLTSKD